MKRILITVLLFLFGIILFSQENNELTEIQRKKLIEEVACFTECTDFILYVDACASLMKLSFKSENLDFYVNDYNSFSPWRVDLSNPELLCVICNWKSRKIDPVDTEHAKVTGSFSYCITDASGLSCDGKNSIICEVYKTKEGWNISNIQELLVLNNYQNANLY
ncbi:MAG: hypothetical protein KQH79_05850 [Bacteroidetes bacterium]|nr:hypothetical protein [Bacteroidota bacterium]